MTAVAAGTALRLGVARELQAGFGREMSDAVAAAARERSWTTLDVDRDADEAAADVIIAIGNVSLYPALVARRKRAPRVLWHGETLPRRTAESGSPIHELLPTGRLLDLLAAAVPPLASRTAFSRLREQAAITREPLANLHELERHAAAFDRIVVDSHDRAEGALRAGLKIDIVPIGYHPVFAGPLAGGGDRPIAALALAHLVGRIGRRQRLLTMVGEQLGARRIALRHVDRGTYGVERRQILERTRVVVDIHRVPGNHSGFRFIVAAAAGAAMVSEPLARPEPLVPGVHYVEAAAADMAGAVADLLADEERRARIVKAAQELLSDELHMRRILPQLLGPYAP